MQRVGIYSGTVYSQEDYNEGCILECALVVSPTQDADKALKDAQERATCKRIKCQDCFGCDMAIDETKKIRRQCNGT